MAIIGRKKYSARRWSDQDWSGFRASHSAAEPFEVVGAAHPFDDRRTDLLPGETSVSDARYFLTYDRSVRGADEADQVAADEIEIDGHWFRVHGCKETPGPGRHLELILIRRQAE